MGTPWELIRPDSNDSNGDSAPSAEPAAKGTADAKGKDKSKNKGKDVELPAGKPQADAAAEAVVMNEHTSDSVEHQAHVEEVEDERDESTGKQPPQQQQEKKRKRWFREMCEMSGELDVLLEEAKKSYDGKRLVDVEGE